MPKLIPSLLIAVLTLTLLASLPLPAQSSGASLSNVASVPHSQADANSTRPLKVFIGNAGDMLDEDLSRSTIYNEFYAAMKLWGRFELVTSPANADLVFSIRSDMTMTCDWVNSQREPVWGWPPPYHGKECDGVRQYYPKLTLVVADARTHAIAFSRVREYEYSYFPGRMQKHRDAAINGLLSDVGLFYFGQQPAEVHLRRPLPDAPMPAPISAAHSILIVTTPSDFPTEAPDTHTQLYAAMQAWGRYKLAASPAEADLILLYDPRNGMLILDAHTNVPLWVVGGDMTKAMLEGLNPKHPDRFDQPVLNLVSSLRQLSDLPVCPVGINANGNCM